jgi:hypothetical protein
MMVQLESITFNHDPSSASQGALNIRRNAARTVPIPEWQRGQSVLPEDSPAAYARAEVQGQPISIVATFSTDNPASPRVMVRAVDNVVDPPGPAGCLGVIIRILRLLLRAWFGNVLGVVPPSPVEFVDGESGPVTLTLHRSRLAVMPVGVHTTEWRWQYRIGRTRWQDLTVTRHRIYVIAGLPTAPWQQVPFTDTNSQLPWTEVLDTACTWAALTDTPDAAAARVTRAVYGLGQGTITYDCPGGGASNYSFGQFDCTAFLDRLHGGPGNGYYVNCTDCATIVSTFANILGCDLWASRMGWGFGLNELLAIGSTTWQTACGWPGFTYHEVAWSGACGADDNVWDACLQVDGDVDPTHAPHTPLLPAKMRFGQPGDATYLDRLVPPPDRSTCAPQPTTRVRRSVR